MNISNGMSVISMGGADQASPVSGGKVYLWPVYGRGNVYPVQPVEPREPRIIMRADPEQREKLIGMLNKPDNNTYRMDGSFPASGTRFEPGLLFNALA